MGREGIEWPRGCVQLGVPEAELGERGYVISENIIERSAEEREREWGMRE